MDSVAKLTVTLAECVLRIHIHRVNVDSQSEREIAYNIFHHFIVTSKREKTET